MISGLWYIVAAVVVVLASLLWAVARAYHLGRERGLLRARAILTAVATRPSRLGPMPPERAWALCCEKIQRLLDEGAR